jgi:rhamnosyltransferase
VALPSDAQVDVGIVIPTRRGGALLEQCVRAIGEQETRYARALLVVDSGSEPSELERLRRAGARIESIAGAEFDHGLTRDRGAAALGSRFLVFLNQDAVPAHRAWLEALVAPLAGDPALAAVQGAIAEFPEERLRADGRRRFYWDSCGPRFYFTSESAGWIARHDGIGFSTVNCALARWAWAAQPFGRAAILEDKLWQKRARARGWRIASAPDALVWHTHDYGLAALGRRCASEGFGWRLVGERYPARRALHDLVRRAPWREWRSALLRGELRTGAERLFPLLRPLALYWGNRWARSVRT